MGVFKVVVLVWFKPGFKDPQAEEHRKNLLEKGLEIKSLRAGKRFDLEINARDAKEAIRIATEGAEKLLAGRTHEKFEILPVQSK